MGAACWGDEAPGPSVGVGTGADWGKDADLESSSFLPSPSAEWGGYWFSLGLEQSFWTSGPLSRVLDRIL